MVIGITLDKERSGEKGEQRFKTFYLRFEEVRQGKKVVSWMFQNLKVHKTVMRKIKFTGCKLQLLHALETANEMKSRDIETIFKIKLILIQFHKSHYAVSNETIFDSRQR